MGFHSYLMGIITKARGQNLPSLAKIKMSSKVGFRNPSYQGLYLRAETFTAFAWPKVRSFLMLLYAIGNQPKEGVGYISFIHSVNSFKFLCSLEL